MNRLFWIAIGAILLGVVSFVVGAAISQYQVRALFYGPDQAGEFIDVFFLVWPLFIVAGGFLGNWFYKRNLTRRSSEHS